MFIKKEILNFIIFIEIINVTYGLTIENHYAKSYYALDEDGKLERNCLKDFDNKKTEIEQLKQQQQAEVKLKDQPIFDIRVDVLPKRCQGQDTPSDCDEAAKCTKRSGYYHIKINRFSNDSFLVECDANYEGGGWTVIQRRQDGSEDFHRTWAEYQQGFGDMNNEFFIGLDKLYALTNYNGPQELMILMENSTNAAQAYAKYDAFKIGNDVEKYILKHVGRFNGTAGDSLSGHMGRKFSTKDQDNDRHASENCANTYIGAWWYSACHVSNLNGHYGDSAYGKGINWYTFSTVNSSLKFVKMMLRRRRS